MISIPDSAFVALRVLAVLAICVLYSLITFWAFGHPSHWKFRSFLSEKVKWLEQKLTPLRASVKFAIDVEKELTLVSCNRRMTMAHLNDDVIYEILLNLCAKDVVFFSQTCKRFSFICNDSALWGTLWASTYRCTKALSFGDDHALQTSAHELYASLSAVNSPMVAYFRSVRAFPEVLVKHVRSKSNRLPMRSAVLVVIHGLVFDLTNFVDEHPGGAEIIMDVSGGWNASTVYDLAAHSTKAQAIASSLCIWSPRRHLCGCEDPVEIGAPRPCGAPRTAHGNEARMACMASMAWSIMKWRGVPNNQLYPDIARFSEHTDFQLQSRSPLMWQVMIFIRNMLKKM